MKIENERFCAVVENCLLNMPEDVVLEVGAPLSDFGVDSLGVMMIVNALEQEFDLEFPADALVKGFDTTLGDLWNVCATAAET